MLSGELVFLLDVDNTLLDNDGFLTELGVELEQRLGAAARDRYWAAVEELREQLGYVDYLQALQCLRPGLELSPELVELASFVLEYPFAKNFYPQALAVVKALSEFGQTVVLTDGDVVFQPRKIKSAGIWDAVQGRVMISIHKEQVLQAVRERFPAPHYVMVDDKLHLLAAMKRELGAALTTVYVRQGHYANLAAGQNISPAADISVTNIAELLALRREDFLKAGAGSQDHPHIKQQEPT